MDNCIYLIKTPEYSFKNNTNKICAFNLENTLIKSNIANFISKKSFWYWINENIKKKIYKLSKKNNVIIFCNYFNLGNKNNITIEEFKDKIFEYFDNISVLVVVSLKNNLYSKPYPNIFDFIINKEYSIKIDKKKSFYVGDFLGKNIKNYNTINIKFADNIGIKYYFGNEYFNNEDINQISNEIILPSIKLPKNHTFIEKIDVKEVLILIGPPGSGKTYLRDNLFPEYKVIDTSIPKIVDRLKKFKNYLQNKNSVIIDDLNNKVCKRLPYISIAKQFGYFIRCIEFNINKDLSWHLSQLSHLITDGKYKLISKKSINSFFKNYQSPIFSEGYDQILRGYVPNILNNNKTNKIFNLNLNTW